MEVERVDHHEETTPLNRSKRRTKHLLLFLHIVLLLIGGVGNPLILRAYFLYGGDCKWFSAFLQTVGFPLLVIPHFVSFFRRSNVRRSLISLTPSLFIYCIVLGLITGVSDYLYSYGMSLLPVTTSSILVSTQLGFTAIFAFFAVRQKFTSFSVNTVVLFIFGAAVLGVQGSVDKPDGESKLEYFTGYVLTLAAAVTYGLLPALMEHMYKHAKKEVTYALVMEMQFIIGFTTTLFCAIGILISRDFQVVVAGYTAGQRAKHVPRGNYIAGASILAGTSLTMLLLVVLNVFPFVPRYIIPVSGMMVGNAMTVTGVTMKKLREDLKIQKDLVEVALALGATPRQATIQHVKRSVVIALSPVLDNAKTVGLISLPGAMTGLIMGGASPLEAVQLQIVVMNMLIGASTVSSIMSTYLCWPAFFTKAYQLEYQVFNAD